MKYFFIVPVFLFFSCKKDKVKIDVLCTSPTSEINASKELIIGNWVWVSELYRVQFSGQLILKTPQTEGYTRTLNINKERLAF